MFGPNCSPQFHHRSDLFITMFKETKRRFKKVFGLSETDQVIFIPGSGTTAIEACIYSAHVEGLFPLFSQHEFGGRLKGLLLAQNKYGTGIKDIIYTQYETSTSEYNPLMAKPQGLTIADCVSSFPYYDPPKEADMWVTVTGKQLGLPPGLGIVVIKERVLLEYYLRYSDNEYSSLNLVRYLNDAIPHTPPMDLIHALHNRLGFGYDVKELRRMIDFRRRMLEDILPGVNLGQGPVVTIPAGIIPQPLHDTYDLYGKNGVSQIFLWAESRLEYERLIRGIKNAHTNTI